MLKGLLLHTKLVCTSLPNHQQQYNASMDNLIVTLVQFSPVKASIPSMHCRAQPPWMTHMMGQSVSDRVKQQAAPSTGHQAECPLEPRPCVVLLPAVMAGTAQATHSAPVMAPAACTHILLEAHMQILQKG